MSARHGLTAPDTPVPDLRQPAILSLLRLSALECRAAPRCHPRAACELLLPDASAADFAEALAHALPTLMTRRPTIWPPGAEGRSFDEDWLVALYQAIRSDDRDSIRFLTARRVRPGAQATLLLLLRNLAERLDIS